MSDCDSAEEEQEYFSFYGKPLEPLDEESISKKKPIPIEDQVAKDAQGRRRFHGAFTGGFSAGFFNTVGSLEGWQPSEFKSSRSEKAANKFQKPEDFMDDEDIGEFGIAPQKVKATDEFNTSRKRKKQVFADGPIPGDPVLHSLIACGNDTIGYLLLRNIGYKHNSEDAEEEPEEKPAESAGKKIYGCEMPNVKQIKPAYEIKDTSIDAIYEEALREPKANTFGMSYSGLDRTNINLFTSSKLVVKEKNNKKLSISGQAFGVGAFEDEDEDIYVKEDLSKYDFELTSEKAKTKVQPSKKLILGLFVKARNDYKMADKFPPPVIPQSFSGIHKVRKSRFAPVAADEEQTEKAKRHEVDAKTRAAILNERPAAEESPPVPVIRKEKVIEKPKESKFKLEPPLGSGLIFNKFVSSAKLEEFDAPNEPVEVQCPHGTKQMQEAVKMKMFGPLTRCTENWLPNSLLCKRFNVPEPTFSDDIKTKQPRKRNLIFTNSQFDDSKMEFTETNFGLQEQTSSTSKPALGMSSKASEETSEACSSTPSTANKEIEANEITFSAKSNEKHQQNIPTTAIAAAATPAAAASAVDPIEKIDIEKNVNLFKAVFLDSESETEDDTHHHTNKPSAIAVGAGEEEEEQQRRGEELKIKVLSDDLLLPQIKPMKRGILSNMGDVLLLSDNCNKREQEENTNNSGVQESSAKKSDDDGDMQSDLYGPKLPARNIPMVSETSVDINSDSDDWVEKSSDKRSSREGSKKEHKKKKKHKKEKHKSKSKSRHR